MELTPNTTTTRIQKIVLSFVTGTYDAEGHLLAEGQAPQQVVLFHPFPIDSASLQQIVSQVEASVNSQ